LGILGQPQKGNHRRLPDRIAPQEQGEEVKNIVLWTVMLFNVLQFFRYWFVQTFIVKVELTEEEVRRFVKPSWHMLMYGAIAMFSVYTLV
jgi:hypothetical protein